MTEINDDDLVSKEVRRYVEKLVKELSIENYTMDTSAGSLRGDNYLGVIAKVTVIGEKPHGKCATLNLIVKSAPRNDAFRSFAPIRKVYDREIYMYTKVLPEFSKLQEERGVLEPFNSIAKFYTSSMDDHNEALIMDNMKELGFKMFDRHKPLDYNHALLVMQEYGKFHALSYAMRDQKPELFKELCENTHESFFNDPDGSDALRKTMQENSDIAVDSLDPIVDKNVYNKFNHFRKAIFETVQKTVQYEAAGKYAVIGHGDSWVNNMLFKYKNKSTPNSPSEICFLDWQLSRAGSPALDLVYFIFTCTDKQLRDDHYDDLIQEYYGSLCSFLRELGSDPYKLLPFKVLQEHLKKFGAYGLYMAVTILYLVTGDTEDIPDFQDLKHEKDATEKFKFESRNLEKYNSRIKGVILDFERLGYQF